MLGQWPTMTLHHEKMRDYHVEDPLDPMNELVCYEEDLGYFCFSQG
jgi:hypothetical protein